MANNNLTVIKMEFLLSDVRGFVLHQLVHETRHGTGKTKYVTDLSGERYVHWRPPANGAPLASFLSS